MNILLTSIGRRVKIVDFFLKALKNQGMVYTADESSTAPGLYRGNKGFRVPKVTDSSYIDIILLICKENNINLVIPFIDPELPVLANARDIFKKHMITVLVSPSSVVSTCANKLETAKFFITHNIPTPITLSSQNFNESSCNELSFPVILKPQYGSGSVGVNICKNKEELFFYLAIYKDLIIQGYAPGDEITIDIFCDFDAKCLSVVPRKRLKVRGGEVERAITVYDKDIIEMGLKVAEALKPIGPINVQCFKSHNGVLFTEINPRFGGGYPLSYAAGVNFPDMIIKLLRGKKIKPMIGLYEVGLLMMRYDDAIFIKEEK